MSWLSNAWNGISGFFSDAAPIINAATSIFGTIQGNKNVDKSLAAQQQENEAVREYEREMWTANNAYNSPMQQKARLEAAGLNSDLMYGQGGVSNTSPSPPNSVSPMDWSSLAGKRTAADSLSTMLDNKLKQAQIDNISADTANKGQELRILSSDADFRKAYNQGVLDSTYSTIRLQGKQGNLTDVQVTETQHKIQKIDAEIESLNAGVKQIFNSIKNDNARLDLDKLLTNAQVRQIGEQCNLTAKQAERLVSEWEYLVRNYDDVHSVNVLQMGQLEVSNESLRMSTSMTYGAYDSSMSTWENVLKFFNQVNQFVLPKLSAK